MAEHSKIEWTDATWNPITGCSLVSEGCRHCYAARLAATRLQHHPSRAGLARLNAAGEAKFTGEVRFNAGWLDQPLRWKRPRKIFVCAHGDLFHEAVPYEWIDKVFAVMALCPQHVFQVLTKRPERARDYFAAAGADGSSVDRLDWHSRLMKAFRASAPHQKPWTIQMADSALHPGAPWPGTNERWFLAAKRNAQAFPLPNVWIGTSVEDQATADVRLPHMLATPAAVRFVSYEPALGPVDFHRIMGTPCLAIGPACCGGTTVVDALRGIQFCERAGAYSFPGKTGMPRGLDWIIVGGESGPNARPMHPDWARSIRDQCAAAGVAFFMKQVSAFRPTDDMIPTDLRVRQFPRPHGSTS